nr:glycosyltransferase [Paenibacillus turpanensis]
MLLSEGFGAGHTQAAHALAASLKALSPDIQTRVIELGMFLHPTIAPLIIEAYKKTVTSQPKLYGMVYRKQYNKRIGRFSQLALHRLFYTQTAAVLRQLRPDAVVCTHPFPNAVISRMKRSGMDIPLCTVITDYDAHGTWISHETNQYLVSTPEVKSKVMERGIAPYKIKVTGIPVHPQFWQPQDRDELRKELGLTPLPTVLVMGGGWGLVDQEEVLERMAQWRDRVQLVFCLGSNEKAKQRLAVHPLFQHRNIHLLGFTKEIYKWMEVSDLLVTKPGGMTCSEALTKGIPMLFYKPIPGQEEENCQYFVENGFGDVIRSLSTVDEWFEKLCMYLDDFRAKRPQTDRTIQGINPAESSLAIMAMLQQEEAAYTM